MKILVCGATGFMGRNLFEYFLKQGHEVHGTAWENEAYHENIIYTDLKSEEAIEYLFETLHPEVVIQAAATTSGVADTLAKPYLHVTDNAVVNSLLLRAAYQHKVKHFVFLSCSVMYQPSEKPMKESDWKPGDEIIKQYFGVGNMKVFIERQCEFYSRLGMKCTAVRHSNTYGPYDKFDPDHSHVLGSSVRKVMEATDTVEVWGAGEEKKDLVYVDDVVSGIDILIHKQTDMFERVNMSSGIGLTINDLVKKIIERSGKTHLKITHNIKKPSIPVHLVYDSSYMKEKYGWEPKVTIEEGLDRTIEWFKNNYKGTHVPKRFQ